MKGEEGLLHELWECNEVDGTLYSFDFAGPRGDASRSTLPEDAKLIWTVWAGSYFEAMTRYYERQDWGVYTTDQAWDYEPYPAEWIEEQRQFFAGFSPGGASDGSPGCGER